MVVVGFISTLMIPNFHLVSAISFTLLILPSWFMVLKNEPFPGYSKAWNIASILFLFITLSLLALRTRPTQVIFAYQLAFLQISKAFNPKKARDILWMWLYAFIMLVIAAIFTRNPLFPLLLFLFLFASIYTFYWLDNLREKENIERIGRDSKKRRPSGLFTPSRSGYQETSFADQIELSHASRRVTLIASVLSILLTILIFFIIPRISPQRYDSFFNEYDTERQTIYTGFSTSINLGSLYNLTLDPTPVMEVKLQGASFYPGDFYLRGGTFDLFTGTSWGKSRQSQKCKYYPLDPTSRGIELTSNSPTPTSLIRQDVTYLDFPTRYIFGIPDLVTLSASPTDIGEGIYKDASETIFVKSPQTAKRYIAYSLTNNGVNISITPNTQKADKSLLQLPNSLNISRISALASRVAVRASTPYEKARKIESFLMNEYRYTLRGGALHSDRPIEDFLFNIKSGHCELFSTAMILMLRTQGVPCRLAVGFHGGEYRQAENSFTVRQCDAHTWVEVLDESRGWMRFDPTPSAPLTIYAERIYFKKLSDLVSAISEKWEEFILGYNNRLQASMAGKVYGFFKHEIGGSLSPGIGIIRSSRAYARFTRNLGTPLFLILAISLFILNLAAGIIYHHWKRKRGRSIVTWGITPAQRRFTEWYHQIVKAIAGMPLKRPPSQTPREFILAVGTNAGFHQSVLNKGCETFYALRYGSPEKAAYYQKELQAIIRELHTIKTGWKKDTITKSP